MVKFSYTIRELRFFTNPVGAIDFSEIKIDYMSSAISILTYAKNHIDSWRDCRVPYVPTDDVLIGTEYIIHTHY